jgi:hypothetical protein
MLNLKAHPHPEWKRLAEEIQPLLETTRAFSYELLKALSGIDIQTMRGRQQFERFRRHALDEWGLWFECERTEGYRIVEVSETPACSMQRMRRAKRQNAKALAITVKTKEDGASPAVVAARRQLASSLGALLLATENENKKMRPLLRQLPAPSSNAAQQAEGYMRTRKPLT